MSGNPPPVPPRPKPKRKRGKKKKGKVQPYRPGPNGTVQKTVPLTVQYNPRTERTIVRGSGPYRSAARVGGRGGYFNKDYFERLGDGFFGDKGRLIGEGVGSLLRMFGLGSYSVKRNSLLEPGALIDMGSDVPKMSNYGDGEICRLSRVEYIGDLLSGAGTPTAFTVESFAINPSNPLLFPWLSAVANNFEEYEFDGLIFFLKSMSSDTSTALSLGTMFGATQYNIADPVFTNKQELLNYEFSNSKKVSESLGIPIECETSKNVLTHLFVAPNNVIPDDEEPKFYNLGTLNLGSEGCPEAGTPIAEVYASYNISLFKPKLTQGGELEIGELTARFISSTTTALVPLQGFLAGAHPANNWAGTLSTSSLLFPEQTQEGKYLVFVQWTGSVAAAIVAPVVTFANCVAVSIFQGNSIGVIASPLNGVSSVRLAMAVCISITGPSAVVTFGDAGTLGTGTTAADLVITQINGLVTSP